MTAKIAPISTVFTARLVEELPSNPRAARRIVVNIDTLKTHKITAGDVLILSSQPGGLDKPFSIGVAWPSDEIGPQTIEASSSLLQTAQITPGSTPVYLSPLPVSRPARSVTPCQQDIQNAVVIYLRDVSLDTPTQDATATAVSKETFGVGKRKDWLTLLLRENLVDLRYVVISQILEVSFKGSLRRFQVVAASTDTKSDNLDIAISRLTLSEKNSEPKKLKGLAWIVGWDTTVIIGPHIDSEAKEVRLAPTSQPVDNIKSAYAEVGGLDKQIAEIRDLIDLPLSRPHLFRQFGLKPPKGILLHGPPGTGKTHLARAIASSAGASLVTISGPELSSAYHGETEAKLREVFAEARRRSPCIIVLDEVDAVCPVREDAGGVEARVVTTLLTLMDGVDAVSKIGGSEGNEEPRVVVVATTNRPNAIDPALRRPGRFDREIEIGIPDAPARLAILKVLLACTPHAIPPEELEGIAKRTHGYVGADLSAVVRDAGTRAIKRWLASSSAAAPTPDTQPELILSDLLFSVAHVRPSALREHFIETPSVRWTDIGGQHVVKLKLKESVEWPLTHPEAFARLGVTPPRGILLYGPPGCSKTLTAKALATESGVNFIAVKGPELLNKYVGESERALREIFRKARGAAPTIIFFDEIDALGTSRSGSEGRAHEGVLTSLLNEMDGIQELVGVIVVAATNRPDVIDSALMRPGRLDRILYVGPPDLETRVEILRIRTSKMAVDPELDLNELAQLTEGCSGAEIVSLCQDAALATMQEDIEALHVPRRHFVGAARAVRRQITRETIAIYEEWRDRSGLTSV
ncbi:hypothetical protein BOTBODRAFT_455641 [Botryobasidium botryosum FD-172 SS1]|uniref:AAA+ ATPase domain-containing protein n=1 Tax=Botryobasidium botryosum (strain FD-172 SS1) TaxID=930990 RepID=A0A067MIR9_BOTB1|nr:hypothetical protein BOTBODRAFT_455641 [Botryobasidium botryosum FD-172 SS1]